MISLGPYASLIKWGLVAGVAIGVWFHGYSEGNDSGEVEVAQLKAKHAQVLLDIADEAREVANEVRMREQVVAQDIAAIATAYEDKRNEAVKQARDSVLADVRAGRIRLRPFPGQASPPAVATSAAACQCDGQAAGSGENPPDMVPRWWVEERAAESEAVGAEADAQLSACQATVMTYYNTTRSQ